MAHAWGHPINIVHERLLVTALKALAIALGVLAAGAPAAAQHALRGRSTSESGDGLSPPRAPASRQPGAPIQPAPSLPPSDEVGQRNIDLAEEEESLTHPGSFRLRAGLDIGAYGSASQSGEAIDRAPRTNWDSLDLKPGVGVHLVGLAPLGRLVLLGGGLSWRSVPFRDDDLPARIAAPGRVSVFGAGLRLGLHWAVDLGPVAIDPFLIAGAGVAFGSGDVALSSVAFGVDLTLRAGTDLWLTKAIGASLSLAYRRTHFYQTDRDAAMGGRQTALKQLVIEVGIVFRAS